MFMKHNYTNFIATATVATLAGSAFAASPIRLEAEDAVLADDHKVVVIEDAKASGGKSVDMKDGNLEFKVTVPATGYYTLWATYTSAVFGASFIRLFSAFVVRPFETASRSFPTVISAGIIAADSK